MNRAEVQERLDAFLALLRRENEFKEELLALRMCGRQATETDLEEKLQHQQDLLTAIERLRHHEMFPILEEIAAFVSAAREGRVA